MKHNLENNHKQLNQIFILLFLYSLLTCKHACLVNVGSTLMFIRLNSLEHTYHRHYSSVWSLVTKLNSSVKSHT